MTQIRENLDRVHEIITAAALRKGRRPEDITLIAVSKNVPVEKVVEAVDCGVQNLGENRVQELTKKVAQITTPVQWHLIGSLQTNKVKYIYDKVAYIHSLDRIGLALELDKYGSRLSEPIKCLVQVNVAGEDSKQGVAPENCVDFLREIGQLSGLQVAGLMTMAPLVQDPEEIRWVFRKLKELWLDIKALNLPRIMMEHLSMGMSGDFEVAVEEGATMIRVGSMIFGERSKA